MLEVKIGSEFDGGVVVKISKIGITTVKGETQCVYPIKSVEQILCWEKQK